MCSLYNWKLCFPVKNLQVIFNHCSSSYSNYRFKYDFECIVATQSTRPKHSNALKIIFKPIYATPHPLLWFVSWIPTLSSFQQCAVCENRTSISRIITMYTFEVRVHYRVRVHYSLIMHSNTALWLGKSFQVWYKVNLPH